jgi:hypothetical protein
MSDNGKICQKTPQFFIDFNRMNAAGTMLNKKIPKKIVMRGGIPLPGPAQSFH